MTDSIYSDRLAHEWQRAANAMPPERTRPEDIYANTPEPPEPDYDD